MVTEFFPSGKDLKFAGGVEARAFFIAKNLAKNNNVQILTSRIFKSPEKERMFGFTVIRVGPLRKYSPTAGSIIDRARFIKSAIATGRTLDADILEGSNFICHFIVKMISLMVKKPTVAWYPDVWTGSWIKNSGLVGFFGEILERINLILGFNAYIAISIETADKLKKFTKKKIKTIPCGVEEKEFINTAKKFKTPTIVCIARLAKYKNIKTLILAFAHLQTRKKNVSLILVGQGPEYKNLKKLSNELHIASKVKFYSYLPRKDLVKIIKSSHIFSLPSLVEGFGIATIEAAAAGIPYVNSGTPIQQEVTRNGLGGFLVEADKPLEFSTKFFELLTKHALYAKKVREGKKLAKFYNWEKIAKETEKVYESLL
jgi:glycosyltransferase involved in cell wall biosynthesis